MSITAYKKQKCSNWKAYKGIRKPTCGCEYCNLLYLNKKSK